MVQIVPPTALTGPDRSEPRPRPHPRATARTPRQPDPGPNVYRAKTLQHSHPSLPTDPRENDAQRCNALQTPATSRPTWRLAGPTCLT